MKQSKADTMPLSMLSTIQKNPNDLLKQPGETPKFLNLNGSATYYSNFGGGKKK